MTQPPPNPELLALAGEACALWQEHLAKLSADPQTRGQMEKLAEPLQRLFAGWAAMGQADRHDASASPPAPATPRPAPAGAASDDGALRLAQFALRLGELEKRVARLESAKPKPGRSGKSSGA